MGKSLSASDKLRPYNDANPIIDTTPAPRQRATTKRARARYLASLTVELMREQGNECYWCGCALWHPRVNNEAYTTRPHDPDDRATFDHKITVMAGGKDTKENGVAACYLCNEHRGSTPFEEYEQWTPS